MMDDRKSFRTELFWEELCNAVTRTHTLTRQIGELLADYIRRQELTLGVF
jgi:hypothetical protein